MKKIDFLALDGRSLRTFLVVLDETSISKAAERLGVTQSAVSHLLDKLRIAFGDPLFVRAGRGITPTERARGLRQPVQAVLDGLKELTDERVFDPLIGQMEFTVAANDFQRDLIFPGLLNELRAEGVDARFRFISSGIPAADLLRRARCQLIVSPFPPDGPDIYQTRLFEDRLMCFYDDRVRPPPRDEQAFCEADRLEVRFEQEESNTRTSNALNDLACKAPRVMVPNFSALAAFMKDSHLIFVGPGMLAQVNLRGLAAAPLPFTSDPIVMYMAWHKRDHQDPAHIWLRQRIKTFVQQLISGGAAPSRGRKGGRRR